MSNAGRDELRDVQESRSTASEREARLRRRRYARPAVDIYSTESEMVVLADMPGVAKSDLEVTLDQEDLIIEGRVAGRAEQESALPWGYFRRFKMRTPFDRSRIQAALRAGVLKVKLPKIGAADETQQVKVD
jgi:HSP20 family protein